ncbi:MAG TPA: hypothetical protein VJ183_20595 [Chloroflexia bacterium]|nr:hypothetical protein [Chloroflexia bacterium]
MNPDDVAYRYLAGSSSERAALKHNLVAGGPSSVRALLRGGIRHISNLIPKVREELRASKDQIEMGFFMGQIQEGLAIKSSVEAAEDLAAQIWPIVVRIGQPALDELCNALKGSNVKEGILAALILHRLSGFPSETEQRLRGVINTVKRDPKYRQGEFAFFRNLVILFFARRVGDNGVTGNLNAIAHREGLTSLAELEEHWRIYAWRYLHDDWGGGTSPLDPLDKIAYQYLAADILHKGFVKDTSRLLSARAKSVKELVLAGLRVLDEYTAEQVPIRSSSATSQSAASHEREEMLMETMKLMSDICATSIMVTPPTGEEGISGLCRWLDVKYGRASLVAALALLWGDAENRYSYLLVDEVMAAKDALESKDRNHTESFKGWLHIHLCNLTIVLLAEAGSNRDQAFLQHYGAAPPYIGEQGGMSGEKYAVYLTQGAWEWLLFSTEGRSWTQRQKDQWYLQCARLGVMPVGN